MKKDNFKYYLLKFNNDFICYIERDLSIITGHYWKVDDTIKKIIDSDKLFLILSDIPCEITLKQYNKLIKKIKNRSDYYSNIYLYDWIDIKNNKFYDLEHKEYITINEIVYL